MTTPRRILVAPLRFIGDGILTVPLLRALKQTYEHAHIDLLLPRPMMNLFESCPYIDERIEEPKSSLALMQTLRQRDYHLGFVMRRSVSQALWFKLAGIRHLVGYDDQRFPSPFNYQRWGWFLDNRVRFPELTTSTPHVKTYLALLDAIEPGHTWDESLELWADENDKLKVAALFNQHGMSPDQPVAIINTASASREKAMQPEQFVPAVQELAHRGFQLVALGVEADRAQYDTLARMADVPMFNLCGQTSLRQSFAMMLKTRLLLSLDSAPIHMAVAAGVPHIIGVYGPTNERQWRPYPYEGSFTAVYNTALSCRPCLPKVCSHNRCRVDVTGEQVRAALLSHVEQIRTDEIQRNQTLA